MELNIIKGIGDKTITLLNKLNIYTIDDLVNYYPFRYEILDKTDKNQDEELVEDLLQTITVFSYKIQGKRKTKTKQLIEDFSKKITELYD